VTRRLVLCLAACAIAAVSNTVGAVDLQPLTFDAKSVGAPNSGARAELWRPAGADPFPAVLVLHGCGGVEDNDRTWASRLAGWGYMALVVDSFGRAVSAAFASAQTSYRPRLARKMPSTPRSICAPGPTSYPTASA
jgi:poly(3-hydroxybutyrate) depolymerase